MLPLWVTILFLGIIPAAAGIGFKILSFQNIVIEQAAFVLGAGCLGLLLCELTVGSVILHFGGQESDGRPKKKTLACSWGVSMLLAMLWVFCAARISLWGWLVAAHLWLGFLVMGLTIGFLLYWIVERVKGNNPQS